MSITSSFSRWELPILANILLKFKNPQTARVIMQFAIYENHLLEIIQSNRSDRINFMSKTDIIKNCYFIICNQFQFSISINLNLQSPGLMRENNKICKFEKFAAKQNYGVDFYEVGNFSSIVKSFNFAGP